MPSSSARHTARSCSAASPLIISPPTAPQPKPSSDMSRPVLPNLRFSIAASVLPALCFTRREIARQSDRAGGILRLFTSLAGPEMNTTQAADPALIEDLVAANRILYDQGVVDGFGHVSVRHDKRPEHFLLARSMAPGLVAAADIMEFDREGETVDPQGRTPYLERFIHSEIFKTRPEVQAVVHSHSPSVIPFGVVSVG